MQQGLKLNGQMRALAIALGGAIVTSVIAMFVPTGVWEAITGSTGISELVPATAAPLGDTARAMIAFLFGATAFAVIAAILLRKPVRVSSAKPAAAKAKPVEANVADIEAEADEQSFIERMRGRIADFAASRRGDNVVTELSDLPKLRAGDAHPDAPPRRPISAHRDFADIAPQLENQPEVQVEEPVAAVATAANVEDGAIAAMVDRLETAVALREEQLAKLEAIATTEAAKPQAAIAEPEIVAAEILEPAPRPVVLEAVPSGPAKTSGGDEMDAALRSALETLHRMNARTR
jgi:hypothetical protein